MPALVLSGRFGDHRDSSAEDLPTAVGPRRVAALLACVLICLGAGGSLSLAAEAPEIRVTNTGGGEIVNGGLREIRGYTDGGSVIECFVQNTGTAPLTVGTISLQGTGANVFTVSKQPTSPVPPNGSTTFEIRFNPTAKQVYDASASFSNNDADENPFTFSIRGSGEPPPSHQLFMNDGWIPEGNFPGTPVGKFEFSQPGPNRSFSFIDGSGDDDNDEFVISGSLLCLKGTADYEVQSHYTVRIRATHDDLPPGTLHERSFDIYVFDMTESVLDIAQEAYIKASNTGASDIFGHAVAVSGNTVVVGAPLEDSGTTGINSIPDENGMNAGAAYVFVNNGGTWTQQAYLKGGNTGAGDRFGISVSISGDTIVIGAAGEDSSTSGVNSTPDESASDAGAVYVFTRAAGVWSQQAYLKASQPGANDQFGGSVSVAGSTVLVGAYGENSSSSGVNSTPNTNADDAGAAYIFTRTAGVWSQQAYLKAAVPGADDRFGTAVALSEDTAVIGAPREDSSSSGVIFGPNENAGNSGAAYVFTRQAGSWTQQAYLKAGNTGADDNFGASISISADTLVVGAPYEDSRTTGINSPPVDDGVGLNSGAAYVFFRDAGFWTQQAYVKGSYVMANGYFGSSVAVSGDTLVVGAPGEGLAFKGIVTTPTFPFVKEAYDSGAAFVYFRRLGAWTRQALFKASNSNLFDQFGAAVAIHADGILVTSRRDSSSGTGVNSLPRNSALDSGAAYAYRFPRIPEISIQGNGAYITDGDLTPTSVDHTDFGGTTVKQGSITRTFTVRNTGTIPLGLGSISFSGPQASAFSVLVAPPSLVAPVSSATFQIKFDPSITGLSKAALNLNNEDADEHPFVFVLQGTGINPDIEVSGNGAFISHQDTTPSPADHTNFGGTTASMGSIVRTFTVHNTGTTPLLLGAVSITGPQATSFSPISVPPSSLDAGDSASFQIAFSPGSTGFHEATVSISNNTPDKNPFTFTIQGLGLSQQSTQTITFSPPATLYVNQGPLTLSASATSGLPVAFSIAPGPATLNGNVLTLTNTGAVKITATQAGNDIYRAAPPITKTITVKVAPTAPALVDLLHVYDGSPQAARVLGGTGEAQITYTVNKVPTTSAPVNAGTYPVKAVIGGKTLTGNLIIARVPLYIMPHHHRRIIWQENPPLTMSYAGFVGADTEESVFALPGAKRPVVTTKAKPGSPGGWYPITASGAATTNYQPVYAVGQLVVETFAGMYEALLQDEEGQLVAKVEFTMAPSCLAFSGKLTVVTETSPVSFTGDTALIHPDLLLGGSKPAVRGSNTYRIGLIMPLGEDSTISMSLNASSVGGGVGVGPGGVGALKMAAPKEKMSSATLSARSTEGKALYIPPAGQPLTVSGAHTMILHPVQTATPNQPEGAGHATATIDAKAVLKVAGKLADGTTLTASLMPDAQLGYRLFAQPYARTQSHLAGWLDFEEHLLLPGRVWIPFNSGTELVWQKTGLPKDKSYRSGISTLTQVTVDPWIAPTKTRTLASLLELPPEGLFNIAHSGFASASVLNLPVAAKLETTNKITITSPVTQPPNLTKWTATITAATGAFSGSFELVDAGKKRAVPFSGVLRQAHGTGGAIGAGHTLVPALPTAPSSETISGAIQFTP